MSLLNYAPFRGHLHYYEIDQKSLVDLKCCINLIYRKACRTNKLNKTKAIERGLFDNIQKQVMNHAQSGEDQNLRIQLSTLVTTYIPRSLKLHRNN